MTPSVTTATPTATPTATGERRSFAELWTWVVLAALPPAVFLLMGVQPMARVLSVDPTFYTGYIDNGPDLIARYGIDRYFWSRVGMVVPARITNLVFGPVAGFYALRYAFALLAIGSAYVLFRRTWSRSAGLLVAVIILVNPVVLRAWTSDYPDGAVIAYLLAGTCFLLTPSRRRLPWLLAAGTCFTLAIHSNLFAVSLVAAIVAGHGLVLVGRDGVKPGVRRTIIEGALLTGVFVIGTLTLAVLAKLLVGSGNLWHPTIVVMHEIRAGLLDPYHSKNLRWALRETQLWVVPLFLVVWVAVRLWSATRSSFEEAAIVLIAGLEFGGFAVWQFFNRGQTLENYLYSSWLWSGGSLLAAVALLRVWSERHRVTGAAATVAVVVITPLAIRSLAPRLHFFIWPWAVAIVVGTVLVVVLSAAALRHLDVVRSMLQTAVIVVAAYVLTVGKPQGLPQLPGQATQPQASYGDVFLNRDDQYLENYRIITRIPSIVPSLKQKPGRLITWWSADSPDLVQYSAAMYLWRINAVMGFSFDSPGLPNLTSGEQSALQADPPRFVLLLGVDGKRFPAAVDALDGAGLHPHAQAPRTIRAGESRLVIELVELKPA